MIPMNAHNTTNKKQKTNVNIKHDYHFAALTNMSIHTHRHSHSSLNGKNFWKEMPKNVIFFFVPVMGLTLIFFLFLFPTFLQIITLKVYIYPFIKKN